MNTAQTGTNRQRALAHRSFKNHPHAHGSLVKWQGRSKNQALFNGIPCFNYSECGQVSVCEKLGRALCRACADKVSGREFPMQVQPVTFKDKCLDTLQKFRAAKLAADYN
jgi:hypothetical protein